MQSDKDSVDKFIFDNKLASKKATKAARDDDDAMLWHDLQRLCVVDPDTRSDDNQLLRRIKQLRGL